MKSEKLKPPFKWEERRILIEDRVWYVPPLLEDFDSFSFPGWNHPLIFEKDQPIHVEYCSGNGAWIAQKAHHHRSQNWVAIEKKFERVRKIWSKTKQFELSNLLTICGEGWNLTRRYFPSATVDNVYVNFPDPWPKTRHIKHRIIQKDFVEEVYRILKLDGVFTLVTDDSEQSLWMRQIVTQHSGFSSVFPAPHYVHDYPDYGTSYFEELWRQQGKSIYYHVFKKIERSGA